MILRNERYRGAVRWNVSEWHKDPDTGKRFRTLRRSQDRTFCAAHRQGGPTACPVGKHARRDIAERAVLDPIRHELLEPEAVELGCRLIRDYARAEITQAAAGEEAPAVATTAAQIAELQDLIAERGALAATLRPVVADLREKMGHATARKLA